MLPLLILPNARARKLMRIVADISKTVLYVLESGEMTSCSKPSSVPKTKMGPMSISRALKKTETAALARPYMMTHSQTGWRSLALMTSSRRASASSRLMTSCSTSLYISCVSLSLPRLTPWAVRTILTSAVLFVLV